MTWTAKTVFYREPIIGLGLILCLLAASPGYGQLPNQSKKSPLNFLGRFHGIGYSDGYHTCPDNQCQPKSKGTWLGAASFSAYHEAPTAPPPGRFQRPAPSYEVYQSIAPAIGPTEAGHASEVYPSHPVAPHISRPGAIAPPYSPSDDSMAPRWQQFPILEDASGRAAFPPASATIPPKGANSLEPLPPPQPLRPVDQTRRAIPGSTRPYNANIPSKTFR